MKIETKTRKIVFFSTVKLAALQKNLTLKTPNRQIKQRSQKSGRRKKTTYGEEL